MIFLNDRSTNFAIFFLSFSVIDCKFRIILFRIGKFCGFFFFFSNQLVKFAGVFSPAAERQNSQIFFLWTDSWIWQFFNVDDRWIFCWLSDKFLCFFLLMNFAIFFQRLTDKFRSIFPLPFNKLLDFLAATD